MEKIKFGKLFQLYKITHKKEMTEDMEKLKELDEWTVFYEKIETDGQKPTYRIVLMPPE